MRRFVILLLVAACSASGGARAPIARIDGETLRAGYGTLVTLDASPSFDPDGDRLQYRWRIASAPEGAKAVSGTHGRRFTLRTAPASASFPLRPSFGPVAIPRGGEGETVVEVVVSDGARRAKAVAHLRSAAPTGGWPRAETGHDLTVTCGAGEDAPARWRLVETPAASRAVVLEPTRCLARVRADLAGRYVLEDAERGQRIPFWYGDWVGHEECARTECHPREHQQWLGTKHASVFTRGLDGTLARDYGPACYGCHTLGDDAASRSIGFSRAATLARWTPPTGPDPRAWEAMPASLRLWANVQCEQCHGPGRFWTGLSSEQCAQCHDAPPRYRIVADFRQTRMSIPPTGATATRADCATCHSAHGGIGRLRGATRARPLEEPQTQGVTCAVCHDPHEARFVVQLRRFGDVTLAGQTFAAGKSAVCFSCHGGFEGPDTLAAGRAPHAPQGWMLMTGVGGKPAVHAAVANLCVGCHMARPERPAARAAERRVDPPGRAGDSSRGAMGGHAFVLRGGNETLDLACRGSGCHDDVRGLEVGGGLATRRLAESTTLLSARVGAAVRRLAVRGCNGSAPAGVTATLGDLVLVDALGRTLEDCARRPLVLPASAALLGRAATLLTILERDRSRGAHNMPLAAALVAEGLGLLYPQGSP